MARFSPPSGRIRASRYELSGAHVHAADAGGVVHDDGRAVGSSPLLPRAVTLARSMGGSSHVDRHRGRRADSRLPSLHHGHLKGAAGRDAVRLCNRMANRSPNTGPVPAHHLLGNRQELALGLTLMILTVISGQEILHLVHWAPALTVTLIAPLSVVLAARAA